MSLTSLASSVVLSLRDSLGVPSTRLPVNGARFVSFVLPPVVCAFAVALLAVTPKTRVFRVALWPLIALLALRGALSVDMSLGKTEHTFLNVDLSLFMFSIAIRTLDWTLAKGPLLRHPRPANSSRPLVDALDLVATLRGHDWEWSGGLYIPRETRPTNRMAFVFYAFLSGVAHTFICGAFHRAVLTMVPLGLGPAEELTVFDETLPFLIRYLRASIISTFGAFAIYAVLQMGYDFCTVAAVLILGQDPAQWPPAFEAPWFATSLSDFWGRRWHQWFRRIFLFLGGYPLSFVLGRAGIIIGAFLSSAIMHHVATITLNSQIDAWRMFAGFGMMGPGVLLERAFYRLTGRRVGGMSGWIWTMGWLLLWGTVIIEGFAKAGLFGCASYVDGVLPVRIPVEHLVADFDAWLHTI